MKRLSLVAFVVAAGLIAATPALADDLFTLTSTSTSDTLSFTLPASPASPPACPIVADGFCIGGVTVDVNGTPDTGETIGFYTSGNGGGLTISDASQTSFLIDDAGAQLFSGTLSAPTFIPGMYALTIEAPVGSLEENFDLTIASPTAATPEPSSLALLGTGLLGAMGVARRRFFRS